MESKELAKEKKELCNGGEKKETVVRKDKSRKSEIHYVSCVAKGCSKLLHPEDAVLHGQICGAIFVDCQFCSQKDIKRQDLENHYNDGCTKAIQCNECGSFFNTTELDSHNCISALKNQVSCLKTTMIVQNKEQAAEIKKRDIHIDFLRHEYATLSDRIRVIENIFRSIPNAISKHSHHTGKHGDHHGSHQVYSHDHVDLHYDSRHLKRTHTNKSRKHSAVDEISDGIDEDEFYSLDGYSSEEEVLTTIKEQPEEIIKDIVCKNGFVLDSKLQQKN